jgi:pimeloyl-ACP methyl ester carboxylesterase
MLFLAGGAACSGSEDVLDSGPYAVSEEKGTRQTPTGDRLEYTLFVPQPRENLPPPPWPGVVLTHGFARDKGYHQYNARYLASRGMVVLTPDMATLLTGETGQIRNISNLVDHVRWLVARAELEGDRLRGVLDKNRIGLAGHSAGGAVTFEAAVRAQQSETPVQAVCLLDAVPWERTLRQAGEFPSIALASFRSEPSACNANGNVRSLLARLPFPVDDVRIVGANHCAPENPSDELCILVCGADKKGPRALYQRLLYLFMRDALDAPRFDTDEETLQQALVRLEGDGRVVRTMRGTDPGSDATTSKQD